MKKLIALSLGTVFLFSSAFAAEHRGRIQIQGSNPAIEKSSAWDSSSAISASDALKRLDNLWSSLSAAAKKDRQKAYDCAKNFIQAAKSAGGVSAPVSKTCQDPSRKDRSARIDIEVRSGKAFTK